MYAKIITLIAALSLTVQAEKITYEDHIKDIFNNSCSNCHKPSKRKGGLNLMIYDDVLKGGSSGKIVEPGNIDSLLVKCVTHEEEPIMPPKGPKLEEKEIELIRSWIKGGLLETASSQRVKVAANTSLAMSSKAVAKGTVTLPEYLNLQPFIETKKANPVTALAASPYSPLVAAGGYKQVLFYNTENLGLSGVLPFPEGQIYDVKFSRDGTMIIASGGVNGKKGVVCLWDVKTGKRLFKLDNDFDVTISADVSSDRKFIATGSSDKLIKIYSATDGSLIHNIKQHSEWITHLSFSPDAVLLATGDRNGHVHVWEVDSGQKMYSLMHHKRDITQLSWRADSNLLASSSEDGEVVVWNMMNGNQQKRWKPHNAGTTGVMFTNNGSVVTCGRDNIIRFHDPGFGHKKTMKNPDAKITLRVIATPDSKYAVSADLNGELTLWDIEKQKEINVNQSNPDNLLNRIAENRKEVEKTLAELEKSKGDLQNAKQKVDSFTSRQKRAEDMQNQINAKNNNIKNMHTDLGKTKGDQRKEIEKRIKLEENSRNELGKQLANLKKEIQQMSKNFEKDKKDYEQKLARQKGIEARLQYLDKEKIRWEAEMINGERHNIIGEINKLISEEKTAKLTQESLKILIEDNYKKADELEKKGDAIEKAETDDEALDTLVYRYDTIIRLRNEAEEAKVKIKTLGERQIAIKGEVETLQAKEKQFLSNYLSKLPDDWKAKK